MKTWTVWIQLEALREASSPMSRCPWILRDHQILLSLAEVKVWYWRGLKFLWCVYEVFADCMTLIPEVFHYLFFVRMAESHSPHINSCYRWSWDISYFNGHRTCSHCFGSIKCWKTGTFNTISTLKQFILLKRNFQTGTFGKTRFNWLGLGKWWEEEND